MCGIAGVMTANGRLPDMAIPEVMRDALVHRGPDGQGQLRADDVGMTQTRLAVIDLETGDQPLFDTTGSALVANGEIYNFVELRDTMADEKFTTSSDCEPALKLYRRDGLAFTDSLRGMYALAIHDVSARRLVLARDPFGIKPLYYADTAAGFAFASEPQALIRAGLVEPKIHRSAATELLQLQFSTGRGTIFEGIDRVLPGETMVVAGGKVVERRKRAALPAGGTESWTEAEALEQLERALVDSVSVHQRSDVPYGMFLSGGIDSSVVLALMARLNDRPVRAFTAGFGEASVSDERDHARNVAKADGAEHVEVEFTEQDFRSLLPQIAGVIDDDGRLRGIADLQAGRRGLGRPQGYSVGRGRRRAVRGLWPLSQPDAAVVVGWQGDALARCVPGARRAARRITRLARRHRRQRKYRGSARAYPFAGCPGGRLRRLAAA